jgi:hypothetical protein
MLRWRYLSLVAACVLAGWSGAAQAQFNPNTFQNLQGSEQTQLAGARDQALIAVQNALEYLRSIGPSVVTGQNAQYNRTFGQYYDNSSANPLAALNNNKRTYISAELNPFFDGIATPLGQPRSSAFTVTTTTTTRSVTSTSNTTTTTITTQPGVLQNKYAFTTGGQLAFPPEPIYIHSFGSLYGSGDGIYRINTITTTALNSNTNSNSNTNFNRQAYLITGGTFFPTTVPSGPPPGFYQFHYFNPANSAELNDPSRYSQLVQILNDVRSVLEDDFITFEGDLENNLGTIQGLLNASVGSVTRGFGQYGYSTSNSLLAQQRRTDIIAGNATNPLEWWEDTGLRDGNGNLLPGEINDFFEKKFGLLYDGSTGTLYVGQRALDGTEQVNDGLYDSSNHDGEFENKIPLWQQLIGAILAGGDSSGDGIFGIDDGRQVIAGLNEINAQNGNVNIDSNGFFGDLFPQDRDVGSLLNFISDNATQSTTSSPTNKILNAAPSLGTFLLSDGIVVPLF